MDLSIPDPRNPGHFLSASATKDHIDSNKLSIEDLRKFLPNPKMDTDEKKSVLESKKQDKAHDFKATKVRMTVKCDQCAAVCAVYSDHAVGRNC